jgi:hypothetical protein
MAVVRQFDGFLQAERNSAEPGWRHARMIRAAHDASSG